MCPLLALGLLCSHWPAPVAADENSSAFCVPFLPSPTGRADLQFQPTRLADIRGATAIDPFEEHLVADADPFEERLLTDVDPFDSADWAVQPKTIAEGVTGSRVKGRESRARTGGAKKETKRPFLDSTVPDPQSVIGRARPSLPASDSSHPTPLRHLPTTEFFSPRTAQLELLSPSELEQAEGYDEAAQDWSPKPLDSLTVNIADPKGLMPRDFAADRRVDTRHEDPLAIRSWPLQTYYWAATCFCHNPLYFGEINLERYGYGCGDCLQPAVSAAHFFGTVPILPYCMATHCPWECDYTLGHYRPGSCAPWRTHCEAPNCQGGLTEAGVVTGLILLIP